MERTVPPSTRYHPPVPPTAPYSAVPHRDTPRASRRRRTRAIGVVLVGLLLGFVMFPGIGRATVEEQRARLPPPATCADGVEGVWLSHTYNPNYQDWYMFTLRIRRKAAGSPELVGEIESHSWNSSPQEAEPPACRPGLDHWTVFMPAVGTEVNGLVNFGGTSWRVKDSFCGTAPGFGSYNLDHFSGQIDPTIQEFQSVNNDGGRSVNDPTVFRRIGLIEPFSTPITNKPSAPTPKAAPSRFFGV